MIELGVFGCALALGAECSAAGLPFGAGVLLFVWLHGVAVVTLEMALP